MIFSRGRGGRHARDERAGRSGRSAPDQPDVDSSPDVPTRDRGPYDVTEAPAGVERLDLGSLRIPAVADVEIRVQADPDGSVQQVVLLHGENALQLGVFAAPRSEGIWDEVRQEIRESLFKEGTAAEESDGEYGVELRARVRTPDGQLTDLRFVGIDGPRWMVRGVYQGRVASDPGVGGPLVECLHGLVVDRGQEAKPVREPLPLRLPREIAERQAAEAAAAGTQPGGETVISSDGGGPNGSGAAPRINGASDQGPGRGKPSPRPRGSV
ncbi:uncharacterized protein DUF3710 [Micromonospora pisi]|uniref:Uncharacterized protein DUF3710 n=1 Tax=Micromonospora pisi TaxID=589240 RepID=A0A495JPQ0_9ACTN|nr:uncharacterized protein DUF3710 [Micromonospora pisi]